MSKKNKVKGDTKVNKKPAPPKPKQLPKEKKPELSKKDQARYHNLLEELEAVCRHYATVDEGKTETNKTFKEELTAITKRKESILKDIDQLKRPLPLFSGKPLAVCALIGCSEPSIEGSDHCKKHDREEALRRRKETAKKKAATATNPKREKAAAALDPTRAGNSKKKK